MLNLPIFYERLPFFYESFHPSKYYATDIFCCKKIFSVNNKFGEENR